jgi:hypothetical protein
MLKAPGKGPAAKGPGRVKDSPAQVRGNPVDLPEVGRVVPGEVLLAAAEVRVVVLPA